MLYLLFASSSQLTIGSVDAMTLEQRRAVCHPISDRFARRQGQQPFTIGEKQLPQLRKRVWCVH
jgi:hypothetical protein